MQTTTTTASEKDQPKASAVQKTNKSSKISQTVGPAAAALKQRSIGHQQLQHKTGLSQLDSDMEVEDMSPPQASSLERVRDEEKE